MNSIDMVAIHIYRHKINLPDRGTFCVHTFYLHMHEFLLQVGTCGAAWVRIMQELESALTHESEYVAWSELSCE